MEPAQHEQEGYPRRYARGNVWLAVLANLALVSLVLRWSPAFPHPLLHRDNPSPADWVVLAAAISLFVYGREGTRRLRTIAERIWAGGALATDSWGTLLTVRGRVLTAATLLWALGALRFFLRIPDLFMVTAAGTLALVVLLLVDSQAVVRRLELGSREEQVVYRPPGPPDAGG